jgi:hypothetical protein
LGGNNHRGIDCSHFVYQICNEKVSKVINADFFTNRKNDERYFKEIPSGTEKQGDLIVWGNEHIGIVVDPFHKTFIGVQTSTGVASAQYGYGYWAVKRGIYFLQIKEEFVIPNKPDRQAEVHYRWRNAGGFNW